MVDQEKSAIDVVARTKVGLFCTRRSRRPRSTLDSVPVIVLSNSKQLCQFQQNRLTKLGQGLLTTALLQIHLNTPVWWPTFAIVKFLKNDLKFLKNILLKKLKKEINLKK